MIWNSVIIMTVVDLLIVGIAGSGLVFFLRVRKRDAKRQTIRGFGAIILGLMVFGGFFFADLLIMHVLPLFVPRARAMAIMTEMHLNLHWPMLLAGIGLTGFGLVAALRQIIVLVDRFDALEIRTSHELKRREEAEGTLRESEARLKRALRQAKLGYWRWSFAKERLSYWLEETVETGGESPGERDNGYNLMARDYHPEDHDRVLAEYHAADVERRGFEIEYRIITEGGGICYIREIAEIEYGADGEPVAHVGTVQDITALKATEAALRESEASLANAQRIARLGYWEVDLVTNELTWSDEMFRIMRVQKKDFDGTTQSFYDRIHPNDRDFLRHASDAAMHEGQAFDIDLRVVLPDGETRYVHEQAEVTFDDAGTPLRMSGTTHDITDRKRAEEDLRKSEARLAGILEIAPEAIISIDRDGCIQLFNQGAESIFGYDSDEVLGRNLEILLPTALRRRHAALVEEFDRAPEVSRMMSRRAEIVGIRKDGSEFPAEASLSKLDLGGEMLFTVLLCDVTERKQVERAILRGKDEAEIANRTKSEFLANMSHELRTPLNAIIGFAEIIMDEVLGPAGNERYRDYAKDINDSGQHLLKIINDILDLSKIETGQAALCVEEIDVPEALRDSLKLIRERARSAGVDLVAEIDSQALPKLRADRRMLKQILVNLLSNAVKFTPQGGQVTVSANCDPVAGYALMVADTGIGIALDDIPKALARFEQVDAKLDRRYEGTGLGLPLSKAFVELHGGSLELESEVGVGTTVTVRFPSGCVGSGACKIAEREAS